MLFTTAAFVFGFLPITLVGFFVVGRRSRAWAAAWLFGASVFFYGYWMPEFTALLLGSIAFNFGVGIGIGKAKRSAAKVGSLPSATLWLTAGIVVDLALLCYFKYANFFVHSFNAVTGAGWGIAEIILPIGISFYTFTQIAFLVDTWSGKVNEVRAVHYGLFVTYFPHLIAGPVLHHAQMMPQLEEPHVYRFNESHFLGGVAIFGLGLFKKIVLADGVAPYADAAFVAADAGLSPSAAEAWLGAFAYTLQLYFDFSGYSDMAIGLSRMFNIQLPFNFDSPYRARNIIDFWRRWHMSLSTFLKDYLYLPLGGSRKGPARRYMNLAATMLLGGLWHGASWSFVIWGGLHGAYLMINHGFRSVCTRLGWTRALEASKLFALASWALTLLAVVAAWVLFRAQTLDGAGRVLQAMLGLAPASSAVDAIWWNAGLTGHVGAIWCAVLGAIAFLAPNSNLLGQRLLAWFDRSRDARIALGVPAMLGVAFLVLINATRESASAFIYFNF